MRCPARFTLSCLPISDHCPSQAIRLFTPLKVVLPDPSEIHKALNRTGCQQLPKQVRGVIWLHFISIPFHVWVNISSLCNFLSTEIASVISVWLESFWCASRDSPAERCQGSGGRLERSGFPFDFHIGAHSPTNSITHNLGCNGAKMKRCQRRYPRRLGLKLNTRSSMCLFFLPHHDCKLKCSETSSSAPPSISAGHQTAFISSNEGISLVGLSKRCQSLSLFKALSQGGKKRRKGKGGGGKKRKRCSAALVCDFPVVLQYAGQRKWDVSLSGFEDGM